jgi:hypothetical protein
LKVGVDQSCQWSPQKEEQTPVSLSPEKMEQIILEKINILENQIKLTDPYVVKTSPEVQKVSTHKECIPLSAFDPLTASVIS